MGSWEKFNIPKALRFLRVLHFKPLYPGLHLAQKAVSPHFKSQPRYQEGKATRPPPAGPGTRSCASPLHDVDALIPSPEYLQEVGTARFMEELRGVPFFVQGHTGNKRNGKTAKPLASWDGCSESGPPHTSSRSLAQRTHPINTVPASSAARGRPDRQWLLF